jgi:hypothetical protein
MLIVSEILVSMVSLRFVVVVASALPRFLFLLLRRGKIISLLASRDVGCGLVNISVRDDEIVSFLVVLSSLQ